MVGGGAPLKKEEIPAVIDYLATNFKGVATPGVVVPGPVKVTINEWDVPTPNSMPQGILHSPISGFTWYAGKFSNVMGRFDPKTQQFKEYHLRPGTNPTSLAELLAGNFLGVIFFTPQTGAFIGRFHPRSGPYPGWEEGDVIEFPIPVPSCPSTTSSHPPKELFGSPRRKQRHPYLQREVRLELWTTESRD